MTKDMNTLKLEEKLRIITESRDVWMRRYHDQSEKLENLKKALEDLLGSSELNVLKGLIEE